MLHTSILPSHGLHRPTTLTPTLTSPPLSLPPTKLLHRQQLTSSTATTMTPRFFWSDVNLWVEDIPPALPITVFLGACDRLIQVDEVREYLSVFCDKLRLYFLALLK